MKHFLFISLALILFSACKKDEENDPIENPPPVNEEELITKVQLTFTDTATAETFVWLRSDPDGDGGNAPTFTIDTLEANRFYTMALRVFNETENPEEEITGEIETEDDEHQFFFVLNNGANMTISYDDADGDGNPIGLSNTVSTGAAENVNLTVILRHEPDKDGAGVADGDPANAGGETDIETTFAGAVM